MKASVNAPRRRKGVPMKDCREYVSRIQFTADDEDDEKFLAGLYMAMYHNARKRKLLIELLLT